MKEHDEFGEIVHRCRVCDELLTDENWSPSRRKTNNYICKKCQSEQARLWNKENPDKMKANNTRHRRKNGVLSMDENKDCASYLGVHITEGLLKNIFKDVVMMPYGNPGFDFICNKDKLIDSKSSCLSGGGWLFHINLNVIADFFVCVAFDNREDLNVLHVWMIPGSEINHLTGASISPSTVHKWDHYKLDVNKASSCCNEMKDAAKAY